jgi:pimeloyl-ACP methyl ester carboxylesterase
LSEEGYATTDHGMRLFYDVRGTDQSAPPVIFPNGLYLLDDFSFLSEQRRVIFYDPRQRGRSDRPNDPSDATLGIERDVDDLDAIRRHFDLAVVDLIGHSYAGLLIALYAAKHPSHVRRLVQLGPMPPNPAVQYPPELTANDSTLQTVFGRIAELQKDPEPRDPEARCRRFWSVLREIYVANPKNADRITWGRCELENERNMLGYWTRYLLPSIQRLNPGVERFANVTAPVLIVHGRKDRSSPYGGALDWARAFRDARLLTIDDAAHAPWIEAPDAVFDGVREFLG